MRRKFTQTVPEEVRKSATAALEKGAQEIVDMARSLAPVDSGDLRDSIGWTWGDAPKGSLVLGAVGGQEYGTLRITVYAGNDDAFYAAWQEFGTQNQRAHPYFFPAYRSLRRRVRSRITRDINKAIKKGMQ
ncbi:HK97-gp10 family putative phage morphogenesis protein [Candidatus Rhodobacter oscarellae]|uniref:HK97-gp10 family putative phage morphogenesis protein n=1 Tax=Candidatus Rhodobacter oscarellae TaxID=1675527 RepID=UPI0019112412|nr:HK97-gp10 family putative phage morphogenesis protein [Candidatus Rhodobacter lobularis]